MAGESMRDIKRRISSIKNTQQITRAMEIVAATKLRRVQQQVLSARPFSDKLKEVLARLVQASRTGDPAEEQSGAEGQPRKAAARAVQHPLLEVRPVNKVAYVIITADRGLAGGYNANLLRLADQMLRREERPFVTIAIGRKARDFLRRTGRPIMQEYTGLGDEVSLEASRGISRMLREGFQNGDFDEVHLIYTTFVSTAVQRPTAVQLLPIAGLLEEVRKSHVAAGPQGRTGAGSGAREEAGEAVEYLYEPSPEAVLNILLPRYVDTQVYRALMEAKAAEHAARMTAMRNATDNAGEMIRVLNLSFNRARQASITKEIAEIVGGAEALAGS